MGAARLCQQRDAAFLEACDLGTAIGCRNLASMYRDGDGVEKSEALANQYQRRYEELISEEK